jgi:hypothetical protein
LEGTAAPCPYNKALLPRTGNVRFSLFFSLKPLYNLLHKKETTAQWTSNRGREKKNLINILFFALKRLILIRLKCNEFSGEEQE